MQYDYWLYYGFTGLLGLLLNQLWLPHLPQVKRKNIKVITWYMASALIVLAKFQDRHQSALNARLTYTYKCFQIFKINY